MNVIPLDLSVEADFNRWQTYVKGHPGAQYADLGQWRRFFDELYGMRSVNFACVDDDRTRGVVSLYLIASPFFGRMLVTCPFFGSGGFYADSPEARTALLEAVAHAGEEHRADFIEFRLREPLDASYQVHHHFLEFDLALEGSEQEVWDRSLKSNVRQNIRKAQKLPLVFSTTSDPHEPYQLISTTIRDLGTPFHARRFFDLLTKHLQEHILFSRVHLEDRLVAAGVMVRFRDRLSTPFIGSLKRFRHTRANYCQYWGLIRYGLENGMRWFDFGRSPRGSTHQQFKEKWGAVPVEVHYAHRIVSRKRDYRTVLNPSRFETFASETWKHLPVFLTRTFGHWIARNIP